MKLVEHEGKKLLAQYGISIPHGVVMSSLDILPEFPTYVLKAQVQSGDRFSHGGILFAENHADAAQKLQQMLHAHVQEEEVAQVLIEEKITATAEYYISFSYSGEARGPVVLLSTQGGTGVAEAHSTPVSMIEGMTEDLAHAALANAHFPPEDIAPLTEILQKMWTLFTEEYALITEINPLFKTSAGYVAGDAKIIIDDDKQAIPERRIVYMQGDIAVLASGGGASMLNMDALIRAGGRPANYTEYSGNPPAEVVRELTKKVLSRPGLKGCWVVGAFANFTDIEVTLTGLLEGLREIEPKPTYPIVIRRDGPKKDEAFAMLERAKAEGFDFHLYDSKTSMEESATIMVQLAYTS